MVIHPLAGDQDLGQRGLGYVAPWCRSACNRRATHLRNYIIYTIIVRLLQCYTCKTSLASQCGALWKYCAPISFINPSFIRRLSVSFRPCAFWYQMTFLLPSSVPLVIKDPFGGRNFRRNFVVSPLLTPRPTWSTLVCMQRQGRSQARNGSDLLA